MRPPKSLTDGKEFQLWRERKECGRKKKIEAGEYVTECLMEEKEYICVTLALPIRLAPGGENYG